MPREAVLPYPTEPDAGGARRPPYSLEAEVSVLGGMFIDAGAVAAAAESLTAEDFFREAHRRLFRSMVSLWERGEAIDVVTLSEHLKTSGDFAAVGGAAYLAQLLDSVPTAANLEHHARIVREKAMLRRLLEASQQIAQEVLASPADAQRTLDEAEALVLAVAGQGPREGFARVKDLLWPAMERMEARAQGGGKAVTGVASGLADLDELTAGFQKGDLVLVGARPSQGKAQPLDAQVLTPRGFVPMWSIREGQLVIGADGKPHRVTGVYPQGEKEVFRVTFSDGSSTECCDEHLWFTTTVRDRKRGEPGSVKSLKEIRRTLRYGGKDRRPNHWIPWVEPVEFEGAELPLHPYLLGLYLGDGTSGGMVRIHNPEPDIQARVAELLDEHDVASVAADGMTCTVRRAQRSNQVSRTKMVIKALGLSGLRAEEKFVPEPYLYASPAERLALLQGLFDTDGYVNTHTSIEYTTVSRELARAVQFLARSLGGRATIHEKEPTYTYKGEVRQGQLAYRMNVSFDNGITPISSEKHLARWRPTKRNSARRIVSVEAVGVKPCQCIRIDSPDHLYVTDDFIVTHNTALALGVAQTAALEGRPVGIFSLEMSRDALVERMLSSEARVDSSRIRTGRLKDDDYPRLAHAAGLLNKAPLYIDDRGGLSVLEMRARARRLKSEHPDLALVVVDYLQLMSSVGETRNEAVGEISRGLKAMAKELDVPVIALSQLSRAVEARPDKRPVMSDLRDSGSLEQDADLILFLYRPEYYFGPADKDGNSLEGRAEVIIGKQRNGATGTVHVMFHKEFTRFEGFTTRSPEPTA